MNISKIVISDRTETKVIFLCRKVLNKEIDKNQDKMADNIKSGIALIRMPYVEIVSLKINNNIAEMAPKAPKR